MHNCNPARQIVDCVDATASTYETEAEAAARVARVAPSGSPFSWDERELARSALGDLPERDRAEFLTDLLCELRGPDARNAVAAVREVRVT